MNKKKKRFKERKMRFFLKSRYNEYLKKQYEKVML